MGYDDLSADVDILTCSPIGLPFNAWPSFGKPFNFEPDKTSAAAFVKHRNALEDCVPSFFIIDEDLLAKVAEALSRPNLAVHDYEFLHSQWKEELRCWKRP